MITDHRRSAAIHESGHAVVARALGFKVFEVLLRPDDSGRTLWGSVHDPITHRHVLVTMAGPIAQHLDSYGLPGAYGLGMRDRKSEAATWAQDLQQIREQMAALGNEAKPWRVYQAATRQLVRDRWRVIRRVASELLVESTISGERLDQIK